MSPLSEIGLRLQAAGLRVVRQPLPRRIPGVETVLLTASGPVTVYVYGFDAIDPAAAHARTIAVQARCSGGNILGRRANEIVYVGVVTDARWRPELAGQVKRVMEAGEHPVPPPPPPPPPAVTPPSASPAAVPDTVPARLQAAGFRIVKQPLPQNARGVEQALLTPAGPTVVYIYVFEAIDPAKAYAAKLAARVRQSPGSVRVRRVDETVYVGTATDASGRRQLASQLDRVVEAGEG